MEGILTDAIQLIQETAVKAEGSEGKLAIVRPPAEPPHVYLTVGPDGKFEKQIASPAGRNHRLITLDEVERYALEKGSASTVVWYDRNGVTVVIDDETRRDFATLGLTLTPTIVLLQRLEKDRPGYDQKSFRKLLRTDFGECQRDPRLFNWVSDLKFANLTQGKGQFSSDRESLGNDIEAQAVSGAGECPDDLILDVRTFDDPSLIKKQGIRCVFEFDPPSREFRLIPFPLAVHNAIELEVGYIGERLREKLGDVPSFRGRFVNA
jgi:hypothetical protein